MAQLIWTTSLLNNLLGFLGITPSGDDKGIKIQNGAQLELGSGSELIVGGDSNTVGMVVKTTTNGSTFVDVTTAAASDDGSTFAPFGGGVPGVNAAMYVGSDDPLTGIKLKVNTLVDPGTGTVEREYYNGSSWVPFTTMAVDADDLDDVRADNVGSVVGSEQVRFKELIDQAKTIVDGDNKYWVRFRVSAALTSDGLNEQVKLHTQGRHEVNANAQSEFFGTGEYPKTVTSGLSFLTDLLGSTPSDTNVAISPNITIAGNNNTFANNTIDGKTGFISIPVGLNTAKPLTITVSFQPKTSGAGDIEIELVTSQVRAGDIVDGTLAEASLSKIVSVNNELDAFKQAVFEVNVEQLKPGEALAISFFRDATAGNTDDTYVGNAVLLNFVAKGTYWRP